MIREYKYDQRNFRIFLGTDSNKCLYSMADFSWLSVINRSATGCIEAIDLTGSEI